MESEFKAYEIMVGLWGAQRAFKLLMSVAREATFRILGEVFLPIAAFSLPILFPLILISSALPWISRKPPQTRWQWR